MHLNKLFQRKAAVGSNFAEGFTFIIFDPCSSSLMVNGFGELG